MDVNVTLVDYIFFLDMAFVEGWQAIYYGIFTAALSLFITERRSGAESLTGTPYRPVPVHFHPWFY